MLRREPSISCTCRYAMRGVAFSVVAAFGVASCEELTTPEQAIASLAVTPEALLLRPGDQVYLTVVLTDTAGLPLPSSLVTWSTSDAAVVTVAGGTVTAHARGLTVVHAVAGGFSDSTRILVTTATAGVSIAPTTGTIHAGTNVQLLAELTDTAGQSISWDGMPWASADTNVATVSPTGLVTGVALGTTQVSTTVDGHSASATIAVVPWAAAVEVFPTSLVLVPMGEISPGLRVSAASGDTIVGLPVSWNSSDTSVVSASPEGIVSARTIGNATVTANVEGVTGSTSVTVRNIQYGDVSTNRFQPVVVTCGVSVDTLAFCWGFSRVDGAIGAGLFQPSATPVGVTGGHRFASVETGRAFACGLTTAGAAYCWGRGIHMRLGNGGTSLSSSATPGAVVGGHTFVKLAVGYWHTCGLESSGAVWCWGGLGFSSPGHASPDYSTPVQVAGGIPFTTVEAGDGFTCGLTTDSLAYCWGQNFFYGSLGDSTRVSRPDPAPVSGGHRFRLLSVGEVHSCGMTPADTLYCWGGAYLSPTVPQAAFTGYPFTAISVGSWHSCGLTSAGSAYCWGKNSYGAMGTGDTISAAMPQPVTGGHTFAMLAAGSGYTCGVTTEHVLYCWGGNFFNQIGDGTMTDHWIPTRTAGQP